MFGLNSNSQKVAEKNRAKNVELNCTYSLSYFDFHYRKESQNPKIIMLGNSLIRHGNWDSLLDRSDVINRGISGDRLECICERLKYLKDSKAKIRFIEGGINDIPWQDMDSLFHYYKVITDFCVSHGKIPVINLLLYISPKAGEFFPSRKDYEQINEYVARLNEKIIEFANKNKIDVIDLNAKISDTKNRILLDRYTTDGVHLQPLVYGIWKKEINKILVKYGI
jgi:lysophospholipase L1-like esterase